MEHSLLKHSLHASLDPSKLRLVEHLHLHRVAVLVLAKDCDHLVVLKSPLLSRSLSNVSVQADVGAELLRELWIAGKCAESRIEVNASERKLLSWKSNIRIK